MLHAIREHWRKRVPFYGINTGHLGFLLNNNADATDVPGGADFWKRDLLVFQLPLLHVESTSLSGQVTTRHAFNDAWVERASGQTAWVQLKVNGEVRLAKVVADGMLVGTAAGSTSYARAMGGAPIPFDTPVLQLVGSNVLSPGYWRSATLPIESVVEMTTLDPQKRPLQAYVDGVSQGEVSSMRVRVSNTAAAELAFVPPYDPTTKLLDLLFDG
jgi:NAD kinase